MMLSSGWEVPQSARRYGAFCDLRRGPEGGMTPEYLIMRAGRAPILRTVGSFYFLPEFSCSLGELQVLLECAYPY